MKRRTRRSVALHEAAHAVAHHCLPLSPRVSYLTIARGDLDAHNAGRPAAARALGYCQSRGSLPAISARGVVLDPEQLRQTLVAMAAGPACDALVRGIDPLCPPRCERVPARWRAGGSEDYGDDVSRMRLLLERVEPFDARGVVEAIPMDERTSATRSELVARYHAPAFAEHERRLLGRLAAFLDEARELLAVRWPAVTTVAEVLLERGMLTGEQVSTLIENAEAEGSRLAGVAR